MKKIVNFITLFLILTLCFFTFTYSKDLSLAKITSQKNLTVDTISDLTNEDIIGQLLIPRLNLVSKLVQGLDNEFYLHHDVEKKLNKFGAIFLDYKSDLLNSYIYGHSSQVYDLPFNQLENLKAKDNIQINYLNDSFCYQVTKTVISSSKPKISGKGSYLVLQTRNQKKANTYLFIIAQKTNCF